MELKREVFSANKGGHSFTHPAGAQTCFVSFLQSTACCSSSYSYMSLLIWCRLSVTPYDGLCEPNETAFWIHSWNGYFKEETFLWVWLETKFWSTTMFCEVYRSHPWHQGYPPSGTSGSRGCNHFIRRSNCTYTIFYGPPKFGVCRVLLLSVVDETTVKAGIYRLHQ